MTVTVTLDDALNGTVSRDNVSRLATMLSGGLAITHVRNLQGRRHIVNPVMRRHYMAGSVCGRNPLLRSLLGVKRTCLFALHMSAIGGKADIVQFGNERYDVSRPSGVAHEAA
jgi:hypothetical protein